jgi:tetratricopeptide (TPR) repeat protein
LWQKAIELSPYDLYDQFAGLDLIRIHGQDLQPQVQYIKQQLAQRPLQYRDAKGLTLRAKIDLLSGAEAADVMRTYYDVALNKEPGQIDALMGSAFLSLSKGERQTAFESLMEFYEQHKNNPDFLHLAYACLVHDRPEAAAELLDEALKVNPNHSYSLLGKAKASLKSHHLKEASSFLDHILEINPHHSKALGLKALIAKLELKEQKHIQYMQAAFKFWKHHPGVYLCLGETYLSMGRLAESLQAYKLGVQHHPQNIQALLGYSQCLLQTGDLDKAFEIAETIFKRDAYQKRAYNLLELRDQIKGFKTLQNGKLHLKMPALDAEVYGERAMAFIQTALNRWSQRYGLNTRDHLHVDFFDRPQDYATRTFGFPQDYGTLGICFGPVITAKTVAAHEEPHHLGKILWHEVGHVITLKLSQHKIPRWFTEGISVYEENQLYEKQTNVLNPDFKNKILEDQIFKIADFDQAFHRSDTIGLAYFQAGWMIEYLIEQFGFDLIVKCVHDLNHEPSLHVFKKYFGDLDKLHQNFKTFATDRAKAYAPKADFTPVFGVDLKIPEDRAMWLTQHPNHIEALKHEAEHQLHQNNTETYLQYLRRLEQLFPEDLNHDNATLSFANYHQKQKQYEKETHYLEQYHQRDFNHIPSRLRLLELKAEAQDYKAMEGLCHELFYLTPLNPSIYETFAKVLEHQKKQLEANLYYEKSLLLKPVNASKIHLHLAKQFLPNQDRKAMLHILKALEISPRNRDALKLYIDLKSR